MENTFNAVNEMTFLNELASNYQDQSPYSEIKKDIIVNLIKPYLEHGAMKSGLQLGCANGYETEKLAEVLGRLVVVDGSSQFVDRLKAANTRSNVSFVFSLFEDLASEEEHEKFDFVFCNYILEHVFDAPSILQKLKRLLKPDGLLFIVVPNCHALSRRIAQKIGVINDLRNLTENDHRHGHRRVYDLASLVSEVEGAGLAAQNLRGVIFKILADFQLNQLLSLNFLNRSHIEALQKIAEEENNMEFADSVFLVASLPASRRASCANFLLSDIN